MNRVCIVTLLIVILLSVFSATQAEDFPPEDMSDVFIIHRPTLDIWMRGSQIIAIEYPADMYPVACDGFTPEKTFSCVVLGVNDSIPEMLQFLADNGEVLVMPRLWGAGDEQYNV